MDALTLPLPPFRIAPRFVERVWGTRDLRPWYQHSADQQPIGEVWLTGDDCLIETGPLAGQSLAAAFAQAATQLLAPGAPSPDNPLLIKMIFATDKLSVQVHPDDELARKYGDPRGKTECWYAIDAAPGARVACGLLPGTTLDVVRSAIADGSLEQHLDTVDVQAGDMIFVDAGTVHAIWPGSILLETQQNCDLTYRMFDYGRPRQLHLEKSLEATRLSTDAGKVKPQQLADRAVLIDAGYFRVERFDLSAPLASTALPQPGEAPELTYLFAVSGSARLVGNGFSVELPERGIVVVPAQSAEFELQPAAAAQIIRMRPRWPSAAPRP